MIKFLSPRNSSTEPSKKWKLNITWSKNVYLSKRNSRKDIKVLYSRAYMFTSEISGILLRTWASFGKERKLDSPSLR